LFKSKLKWDVHDLLWHPGKTYIELLTLLMNRTHQGIQIAEIKEQNQKIIAACHHICSNFFLMETAALGNKKYCIRGHKEMGLEEFYHEESNTFYA
jgi:hypothetical protein